MTRIALLALLLSGCSVLPTPSVKVESASGTRSLITVKFAEPAEVHTLCENLANEIATTGAFFGYYKACAFVRSTEHGITHCEIIATEPKDFEDVNGLALLGHEVWHCFGAKHMPVLRKFTPEVKSESIDENTTQVVK